MTFLMIMHKLRQTVHRIINVGISYHEINNSSNHTIYVQKLVIVKLDKYFKLKPTLSIKSEFITFKFRIYSYIFDELPSLGGTS